MIGPPNDALEADERRTELPSRSASRRLQFAARPLDNPQQPFCPDGFAEP